ncbi:MAG: DUF554 domain-containing protein [Clostridia bacterium]|nr:DUF554 domain-containing protein [Clostridia bacterium]
MPVGVICNTLAIAIGGVAGAKLGGRLSAEFKEKLNLVFGICALGIGITSIVLMSNLPAVILSLILGTILGTVLHLGERISHGGAKLARLFPQKNDNQDTALLVTTIVLFCASGSGIYGSIVSGISGDHSILLAKSILDLFTAMIFACTLGMVVSAIAIPQFLIFIALFLLARVIYPLTTPAMINDFKAVGGLILLATGLRIAKIKDFPIADMIPAMLLVWPISWMWSAWIVPLL